MMRRAVYLSFSDEDKPIADAVEKKLLSETNGEIAIVRHDRVPHQAGLKVAMDTARDHDYILLLVSDAYLRSERCLYEVGTVIDDAAFEDKALLVLISGEERDQYSCEGGEGRFLFATPDVLQDCYAKYWEERRGRALDSVKSARGKRGAASFYEEFQRLDDICNRVIGKLLGYLSSVRVRSFSELMDRNLADLLVRVFPDWLERPLVGCDSLEELLSRALQQVRRISKCEYNQIILRTMVSDTEYGLVVVADDVPEGSQRYRVASSAGLIGRSFESGETLMANDVRAYSAYFRAVSETASELLVPIKSLGNAVGVFNSESDERVYFSAPQAELFEALASTFAARLQEQGWRFQATEALAPWVHVKFS